MADIPQDVAKEKDTPTIHVSREVYIPERWIEKEVRDIEPDVPYVLPMKVDNDYSSEKDSMLLVDEKGRLLLAGNLVADNRWRGIKGADVIDGFGLMRTYEPYTGDVQEGFVVDLRNVNPGEIERIDTSQRPDDEDDIGAWLTFIAELIPVQAVILPHREYEDMDPELSKKAKAKLKKLVPEKPKYNIQGYAAFFPALNYLAAEIDGEMKRQKELSNKKAKGKKKGRSKELDRISTQLVVNAFRGFKKK